MNTRSASSPTALPALTFENLKHLDPSPSADHHPYPASSTTSLSEADNDDTASVFSAASSISTVSSAPEDEDAPFTVSGDFGESVTVYASLEQAVLYSNLRAAGERRRELLAYPHVVSVGHVAPPVRPEEVSSTEQVDDEDEDAYFSMG